MTPHCGGLSASSITGRPDVSSLIFVQFTDQDAGSGISTENLDGINAQRSGVGITGMRERIRHFKGVLRVHSDGAWTRISVMLPISTTDLADERNILLEQGPVIVG